MSLLRSFYEKVQPYLFATAIVLAIVTLISALAVTLVHSNSTPAVSHRAKVHVTLPHPKQTPSPHPNLPPKAPRVAPPVHKTGPPRHARPVRVQNVRWTYHPRYITVKPGDTLSGLATAASQRRVAHASQESWQALYQANSKIIGPNPNVIVTGQKLRIPLDPARWAATYVPPSNPVLTSVPALRPAQVTPAAPAPAPATTGGGLADVPGVPATFAACVAMRESSDGTNGDTVYGIIPSSGIDVEGAPLSVQKAAFSQLYSEYGTQPWAPSDGC